MVLPDHTEMDREKHEQFVEGKCLEAVMTAVIDYVENNFTNVAQIFRKRRSGETGQNIFTAVFEVLQLFFEKEGIDVMDKMRLTNDFSSLFESVEEGHMVSDFVDLVRREIDKYKAASKREDDYEEEVIYFDSNFLYFPKCVLEEMYQREHRGGQWKGVLIQLREEGYLSTNSPSVLVKKLQVGGVRRDFYAVKRELFNWEGFVDVLNLTKEE